MIWGRVDCQRNNDSPAIAQEWELSRSLCTTKSKAASVAGTAAMPDGHGLVGAAMAGWNQGIAERDISDNTLVSCLNERGYIFRAKSEHDRVCADIKAAATSKKPVGKPPRPLNGAT